MGDSKFHFFIGKEIRIWTSDGFFRQGKLLEVDKDGNLLLNDRFDGLTYLSYELIVKICEVRR